jgi:hypothetical protein
LLIYLDFDGTIVEHAYPTLGSDNPGATDVIRALQDAGHEIVLNSMRADLDDGTLEDALYYLNAEENGLLEIIHYEAKKITPEDYPVTKPVFSKFLFLDDTSKGTPLRPNLSLTQGLMVDWRIVRRDLILWGIITK